MNIVVDTNIVFSAILNTQSYHNIITTKKKKKLRDHLKNQ